MTGPNLSWLPADLRGLVCRALLEGRPEQIQKVEIRVDVYYMDVAGLALEDAMECREDYFSVMRAALFHDAALGLQKENDSSRGFCSRWDFFACLFLKTTEADDFLVHQQDCFELDCERFGEARAKCLYAIRSLRSVLPAARWLLHRLMAFEAIRKLFH